VLLSALIFGGCAKPAPALAPAPPAGPGEIIIGASPPMTGGAASFAEGGIFGIRAALEDINKQGGIYIKEYDRKIPVRLIVADCESNPLKAGTLAEDIILRDKATALISVGPHDFSPPLAMIADRYKIPFLAGPGPFESWQVLRMAVSPPWRYSWLISFAIATPAPEGDFRHGKLGYCMFDAWLGALESFLDNTNRKTALLASDDPDGRGWYHAFAPSAQKIGLDTYGTEEGFGLVPAGTRDFTPLINEWKRNNCELLWANCRASFFGTFWRQAKALGYEPKQVFATRAGLFYTDVSAWGGDLPNGICNEMFWHPSIEGGAHGISDTTPMSLHERWVEETGKPMHQIVGWGYGIAQVLIDAIERAGSLDGDKLNQALAETDLMTIYHRVVFDEEQFSRVPVAFGQWHKTDQPCVWENPIVYSDHDFMPASADLIFPIPYE